MSKIRNLIIRSRPKHKESYGYLKFINYTVYGRIFIDAPGFQMFITKRDVSKIRVWLDNIDELEDDNN